eukprot:m.90251 g.90251  ORF g.90251 m.90251 type:complete len:595 (+) comp15255_c0_seq2:47-1831(+)
MSASTRLSLALLVVVATAAVVAVSAAGHPHPHHSHAHNNMHSHGREGVAAEQHVADEQQQQEQQLFGAPEVETEYGRIRGVEEHLPEVTAFYGIPFAAPPLKNLRFRPPIAPEAWNGTRDCTKDNFFHICPQLHITKKILIGQEDCLYMNIYVPGKIKEGAKLPVMFWIYGGGWVFGDDNEFGYYRGKHLAETREVIVVEVNYRLGALGFLALPGLAAEQSDGTTGNYGLQDQQAAMAFVSRNIEKFGGDPKKMIIFGESAGAFSVCWHLVNQISKNFFFGAIMESGTCEAPEFFVSLPRAYNFSNEVVQHLKCNESSDAASVSCMRSLALDDIFMDYKDAWPNPDIRPPLAPVMPYGATIDKTARGLLDRPINLLTAGRFARVPVILGTNLDEGTIFLVMTPQVVPGSGLPITAEGLMMVLKHVFNDSAADAINNYYQPSSFKSEPDRAARILRDWMFTCNTRRTARAISSYGVPTYLYQFVAKLDNWVDYDEFGDYHTLELPFVFKNQYPPLLHAFGPGELKLSDTFTLYWSNLARYGNPNGQLDKHDLHWPQYNQSSDLHMYLKEPTEIGEHLESDACNFWQNIYAKYYFE